MSKIPRMGVSVGAWAGPKVILGLYLYILEM